MASRVQKEIKALVKVCLFVFCWNFYLWSSVQGAVYICIGSFEPWVCFLSCSCWAGVSPWDQMYFQILIYFFCPRALSEASWDTFTKLFCVDYLALPLLFWQKEAKWFGRQQKFKHVVWWDRHRCVLSPSLHVHSAHQLSLFSRVSDHFIWAVVIGTGRIWSEENARLTTVLGAGSSV